VSERDHGVLIVRATGGDEQARGELVAALEPLVAALAGRFAGRVPRADLEQAGMVGLLDALSRFDPAQGTPFESYATPFMIGEMLKTVRATTSPLSVPRPLREAAKRVAAAVDELTAADGRSPNVALIADHTKLDEETVVEALRVQMAMTAVPPEDVPADVLGAEDAEFAAAEARLDLGPRLVRLDGRRRRILALRFGLGMSQRDIAARMGISQMHVSRLLRSALAELEQVEP
jgi:RNA polymerase sigma-B factor